MRFFEIFRFAAIGVMFLTLMIPLIALIISTGREGKELERRIARKKQEKLEKKWRLK